MSNFHELQVRHEKLLEKQLDEEETDISDEVLTYIKEVQRASGQIVSSREREQLRANLRYWAGYVFDRKGNHPNIELVPSEGIGAGEVGAGGRIADFNIAGRDIVFSINRDAIGCQVVSIVAAIIGVLAGIITIFSISSSFFPAYPSTGTFTPTATASPTPESSIPVELTIFIDRDSLTIYVPGNRVVSLAGLQFEVLIEGESNVYSLEDYPAFMGLHFSQFEAPACFVFQSPSSNVPLPMECQNISSSHLFIQTVSSVDVFWYDTLTMQSRLIKMVKWEEGEVIGRCPSDSSRCELSYVPTAPTVTPVSILPTPIPNATPTLWSAGSEPNYIPITREINGINMVYAPSGCFMMGPLQDNDSRDEDENSGTSTPTPSPNEDPIHQVCLDAFWISLTEVTNGQYSACVEAGVCEYPETTIFSPRIADYPVRAVSWDQAMMYAEWIGGSLPTEAQWEYAARGPAGYLYPWGNTFDGAQLNFCDANCPEAWANPNWDDGFAELAPVASYPDGASWVGAMDMAGNLSEWIFDWYSPYLTETTAGTLRVVRGGSYQSGAIETSSIERFFAAPSAIDDSLGFRVIMSVQ